MAHASLDSQQMLISSFLDIAVDETAGTAQKFHQAANWNLAEAIQLFYSDNGASSSSNSPPSIQNDSTSWELTRNPEEREQISSSNFATDENNTIDFLFPPPYELLYNGPFDQAKEAGIVRNKWLLVNVQSKEEFTSSVLNRDTWANEIVAQMIKDNFVFWQEEDCTDEGRKVCTYYKLESVPVTLVIDPVTGQKMRSWNGMVEAETLLEDAMVFIDSNPSEYHANLIQKQRSRIARDDEENKKLDNQDEDVQNQKIVHLPLPEEPECDRNLLCRVAIRLPDGRRIQRKFMKTDSIKLLWSFCSTLLEDSETKPFRFIQKTTKLWKTNYLEYDNDLTFEESGLDGYIISLEMI